MVLDFSDGVSRRDCMTAKVKSCCLMVVHFPSLLYSTLKVKLDQGGTTLRMQHGLGILDFHCSREHSFAV